MYKLKIILMKTLKIFFVIMFLGVNFCFAQTMKSVTIKTSAQCDMCKTRIEKAMKALTGVQLANLDVESKDLKVEYDESKINLDKIKLALNNTGYDADDKPANKKAYAKLPACCKKPKEGEKVQHHK
jgi:periplasmic mercuric ion binding protein